VQIELRDYRDVQGQYDAIVSVEMLEAVGFDFWTTYFQTIDRLLKPGGRLALQAITMPHERMLASRNTHTWIQKYIFPGGLLPSVRAIAETTTDTTHLRTIETMSLRPHYAETLRLWSQQLAARRESVLALGFDDAFYRMWQLYLAYSEAGFRSGYLDVHQWIFQRGQQ
jgi:cyclopropane-fatty-acyl-phospholipid synthase